MAFKTGDAGYQPAGSPNLMGLSGRDPLASGVSTHTVVFAMPKPDAFYEAHCSFYNALDAEPIFLQYVVTNQTALGFTVIFNAPTDSANYELCWTVVDDV